MRFTTAIPALPVGDINRSVTFYTELLEFELLLRVEKFAITRRDAVEIHLWAAADETWHDRGEAVRVRSGAESFLAGTASCRIGVEQVVQLDAMLEPIGIVHPNGHLEEHDYGLREFSILDPDRNLITFFECAHARTRTQRP